MLRNGFTVRRRLRHKCPRWSGVTSLDHLLLYPSMFATEAQPTEAGTRIVCANGARGRQQAPPGSFPHDEQIQGGAQKERN